MDRLCPKCGQRYHAEVSRCPVHRVALVDDPLIGRSLGPFTITGYLGSGAMGVVYRAHPPAAIKILNVVRARLQPELVRRFELEASAISRLENPHTVRLYDAGTTGDGHLYITMELLRGQTLDDLLRARHKLSPATVADVMQQAASALAEAHDKWVIHRDIKPDNLFLEPADDERAFVRVLDFGVVRINTESVARSITGTVAGTPAYMSPEQLKSDPLIDGRSDIYSLGVVSYQALAGRNPFQGEGLMQTIQRHLHQTVPPLPSSVPAPLAALVLSMLHKAREDRPPSMHAVREHLEALGLARPPPTRLADYAVSGPIVLPAALPLVERGADPAFQRARQVTPVARPMDPEPDDETAPSLERWLAGQPRARAVEVPADGTAPDGIGIAGLDALVDDSDDGDGIDPAADVDGIDGKHGHDDIAAIDDNDDNHGIDGNHGIAGSHDDDGEDTEPLAAGAFGDTLDDIAPIPPRSGRRDPWHTSQPPAARPPIDAPPDPWRPSQPPVSRPPIDAPPEPFDTAPLPEGINRTWSVALADDVAPGGTLAHTRRERWRVIFTALIFALGAASGIWLSSRDPDPPPIELHTLRAEARAAIDREAWEVALDRLDRVLAARPDDAPATELRARAASEAAARETWHEILDRIADEQWQAAAHRVESFPAGSVYTARARALAGLIDEGIAEAALEEALTKATRGEWTGATAIAAALAARRTPPDRLPILRAAIERRRFAPTPYTLHLLEARERMNNGDWRLAITRLQQAAEDTDAPDARIARRLFVCSRALGEAAEALRHAESWRRLERDPRYAPVIRHAMERMQARVGRER